VGVTLTSVRKNAYVDSVTLLQVSAEVAALSGVRQAALVMATDLNRELLRESQLLVGDAATAGTNDLVIAVQADSEGGAQVAVDHALALVSRRSTVSSASAPGAPHSLKAAHRALPDANLAVISVPGEYAANEAHQALADGLHVFLFSDNVSVEHEVDLKRRARDKGLLVMGPDCGTAILGGVGLGFANVVRRGRIGLVGASGTGLQEVTTLLDRGGQGISHAIGTGGRDLDRRVGGITTLQALELLGADPSTERIIVVSKTPDAYVAQTVLRAAVATGKPAVACLLGYAGDVPAGVQLARNLDEAARLATGRDAHFEADASHVRGHVRGLFCGGTLCEEAEIVLSSAGVDHELIDFGDDAYTRGRAHPMIDPRLRNAAIVAAGDDSHVGVLLLDFILGMGSHADPAGAALPAIREAQSRAEAAGRPLEVLAHVVGTDGDAQGLARQESALQSAGVRLFASNVLMALGAVGPRVSV
jgi:FdrA protein